ncbi:MAG: hypothetical protein ACXW0L_09375 [Methylosarcina sp.]
MEKRKISYIEPALLVLMQFVSFQTVFLQHTTFNQRVKLIHINCPLLFFKAHLAHASFSRMQQWRFTGKETEGPISKGNTGSQPMHNPDRNARETGLVFSYISG